MPSSQDIGGTPNGRRVRIAPGPMTPRLVESETVMALGDVHPGGQPCQVVLKPNWVEDSHGRRPGYWEPVITDPSIILGMVSALGEALQGGGHISICDAPSTYVSFEKVVACGGLGRSLRLVQGSLQALTIELLDLRREVWITKEHVVVERRPNPPDPRGYVAFDLGRDGMLFAHAGEGKYYGADYDTAVVNAHHAGHVQEYLLSGTAMNSDLFINLPKLKTHKKTGVTCCLKNLVGINGDKNWLPHYVEGPPSQGGDEFPDETAARYVERRIKKAGQKLALALPGAGTWAYRKARKAGEAVLGDSESVIRNGNWEGNDTCWRMALDLNRALLYGNPDGTWREAGERKPYLAIVDGIVGGEGNGPLAPDPVESNVIIIGTDPAAVDAVACKLMGFDPMKVPIVREAFAPHRWPIATCRMSEIEVQDDRVGRVIALDEVQPAVPGGFRPHFGWPSLNPSKSGRSGS
jgi:uncharacterized protein (DUF362 family)